MVGCASHRACARADRGPGDAGRLQYATATGGAFGGSRSSAKHRRHVRRNADERAGNQRSGANHRSLWGSSHSCAHLRCLNRRCVNLRGLNLRGLHLWCACLADGNLDRHGRANCHDGGDRVRRPAVCGL